MSEGRGKRLEGRRYAAQIAVAAVKCLDHDVIIEWAGAGEGLLGCLSADPDPAWREFAEDWSQKIQRMKSDFRILNEDDCCEKCGMLDEECCCTEEDSPPQSPI